MFLTRISSLMQHAVIKADDSEIEIEHTNIACGYNAVSFANIARSRCSYCDVVRSEDCFLFLFTGLIPFYTVSHT
jgi:hypothetical protein